MLSKKSRSCVGLDFLGPLNFSDSYLWTRRKPESLSALSLRTQQFSQGMTSDPHCANKPQVTSGAINAAFAMRKPAHSFSPAPQLFTAQFAVCFIDCAQGFASRWKIAWSSLFTCASPFVFGILLSALYLPTHIH